MLGAVGPAPPLPAFRAGCSQVTMVQGGLQRLRQVAQQVGTSSSLAAGAASTSPEDSTRAVVGAALRAKLGAYERSGQADGKGISSGIGGATADERPSRRYGLSTRDNTPVPQTNSFGVSTVIPGLGILPRKVRTAAEAAKRVRSDGAVILTGLSSPAAGGDAFFEVASSLPQEIFGEELLAATPPVSVGIPHKNNAAEMRAYYSQNWGKEIESALPPWEPNCAHTDGEAYGDRMPPYLFLLFAHQSADGGENALVDSYGVVDAMTHDSELGKPDPCHQFSHNAIMWLIRGLPCLLFLTTGVVVHSYLSNDGRQASDSAGGSDTVRA